MKIAATLLSLLLPLYCAVGDRSAANFCGVDSDSGKALTWDVSTLPNTTFSLTGKTGSLYYVAAPFLAADPLAGRCSARDSMGAAALQGCRGLGVLGVNTIVTPLGHEGGGGFNLTLNGGSADPPCNRHGPNKGNRTTVFELICDAGAPPSSGPDTGKGVIESPSCTYNVRWRHPAFCRPKLSSSCGHSPTPPAPAPIPCATCQPRWAPSWDMQRSTILQTCNDTGMHSVAEAVTYGVMVYDWSNAKELWCNAHPMSDQELLTKQAEMVLAASPSPKGGAPRVWVYRNTIKALNWYSSVRIKLDDPKYKSWFIRFKDYKGLASNNSYHVPACDWFGNRTHPPKCSGFYHDQEQTPNHKTPQGGNWPAYRVDGTCQDQCDCGPTNPCGEYIFDHRGGEVEGRTFRQWFIHEYMITQDTLLHQPKISLGWLDDSMKMSGPTEENPYFQADAGFSNDTMRELVQAYEQSMGELHREIAERGGWAWQMTKGRGPQVRNISKHGHHPAVNVSSSDCMKKLRSQHCVPEPPAWQYSSIYGLLPPDVIADPVSATAEFLLTRGPYAWLGYSWIGCSSSPRPYPHDLWTADYGAPKGPCTETTDGSGVFEREWSKATIQWDCHSGRGKITMK